MSTIHNTESNNQLEALGEPISNCLNHIDLTIKLIQRLIVHYNCSEVQIANNLFIEIVDHMHSHIQLISKIYAAIKLRHDGIISKSDDAQKLDIHLLSTMRALYHAKACQDIIMICDLLEYELIDNLSKWKLEVLPGLGVLINKSPIQPCKT